MRDAGSFFGIALGFLLAIAVVAGVGFLGPTPSGEPLSTPKATLAQANREVDSSGSIAVSPVAAISPSSIEGIGSSTPLSLLLVLLPLVVAVVLGLTANRMYSRRAESE
ncbi:MAG: hypothetical protein HYY68_01845 [Thaumarchaeota archaeon]|nr:hypothetical protein [Nitrososphaerota archaeon]